MNKIVLKLDCCLVPKENLDKSPSFIDGLSVEDEEDLRSAICERIQSAGTLLRLPQIAIATAQVLFHRFFYLKSMIRHQIEPTAIACVYLASKIEEHVRRIRDIINVFNHIRQVDENVSVSPLILDQNYVNLKSQVIKAERRVLKELGFCVHVKHPHKIIVMYLKVLCYQENKSFNQIAWNYMNDSLRSDVFVRYEPEAIACACIYMTARKLQIILPKSPVQWYEIFGVNETIIKDICRRILKLYSKPKLDFANLEKTLEVLKKKYQELRLSKLETKVSYK